MPSIQLYKKYLQGLITVYISILTNAYHICHNKYVTKFDKIHAIN